jgi:hypothetical protein|tara:strand:- start:206 stop:331 length:126 start_codon:yes stop_codon:yes gene_type:complete
MLILAEALRLKSGLKSLLLNLIIVDEAMHQAQFTKAAKART